MVAKGAAVQAALVSGMDKDTMALSSDDNRKRRRMSLDKFLLLDVVPISLGTTSFLF